MPAPKDSLINEWLTRFALNAGIPLGEKERGIYLSMWKDGFADVETDRLQAAFVACLRSHMFKTMPTIGDVRQHLSRAEESAVQFEAERKWDEVLEYIRLYYTPDIPARNTPRISDGTRRAINAAGGLAYLADCDRESLQWAHKRFIEASIRYGQLQEDQHLLPDGEVKNLLAGIAQTKALPGSQETYQEMRERGLCYAKELKTSPAEDQQIERAVRALAGDAPRPPERSLEEQKRILRDRGLLK